MAVKFTSWRPGTAVGRRLPAAEVMAVTNVAAEVTNVAAEVTNVAVEVTIATAGEVTNATAGEVTNANGEVTNAIGEITGATAGEVTSANGEVTNAAVTEITTVSATTATWTDVRPTDATDPVAAIAVTPVTATGPEAEIVAVAVPRTRARATTVASGASASLASNAKAMLLPPLPSRTNTPRATLR